MRMPIVGAIFAAVVTLASPALAQHGPQVPPCEGCPTSATERPTPRPGMWWDPARSGTGMNLEVQNGVLVGTWHGFDETGAPIWYQFSGALEPIAESDTGYWTLEADLVHFAGGNCIDCDYQPSEVVGVRGSIELTVLQRNLISYRIDGGAEYRMQPLVWGTPMPQIFEGESDLGLPMLPEGYRVSPWALGDDMAPWVLVLRIPNPPTRDYLVSSVVMWGRPGSPHLTPYSINFLQSDGPSLLFSIYMECWNFMDGGIPSMPDSLRQRLGSDPACVLRRPVGPGVFEFYAGPLGNVGDDYFFLTAEDGSVIEGHRLLYR